MTGSPVFQMSMNTTNWKLEKRITKFTELTKQLLHNTNNINGIQIINRTRQV